MSDTKSQKRKLTVSSLSSFLCLLSELQQSEEFHSVAAASPQLIELFKETSDQVRSNQLDISKASDRLYESLEKFKGRNTENSVVQLAANFCQKRLLENVSLSNRNLNDFLDPVQSCAKKQTKIRDSFQNLTSVENSVQRNLAEVIRSVFHKNDKFTPVTDEPIFIRDHIVGRKLRNRGLHLKKVVRKLQRGELKFWKQLIEEVTTVYWNECKKLTWSSDEQSNWKVICKEFLNELISLLMEKVTKTEKCISSNKGSLPLSIAANQEPYLNCEWCKEPISKRPYHEIRTYEFLENETAMLSRLCTKKADGLSEDFFTSHQSLSIDHLKQMECSLIEAVRTGTVLVKGQDVMEVDTWGMDCYSRKNIYDSILEKGFTLPEITEWFQSSLLPVTNQQGTTGWNLLAALDLILSCNDGDSNGRKMAQTVKERLVSVGEEYFRVHPKGSGVICAREEGIEAFTLVEEYLGVLHSPWRWFEIQDYLKRRTSDKLPDFYNIILERPKDDPDGYQVSFIDAAARGTLASRISHSCSPNCQVVVVSVNGRLTIAMYTMRYIQKGEELSFDYSSVTESEKEFRSAICLCSSLNCRGSFLHYAGSTAFMHIMSSKHNFLHRNSILLKAVHESLTQEDHQILQVGLRDNRLQNIAITIDKVRMCLQQSSQQNGPPLRILSEEETVQHLWTGEKSIANRFLRTFLETSTTCTAKDENRDLQVLEGLSSDWPLALKLASALSRKVTTTDQARDGLFALEQALRTDDEGASLIFESKFLTLYARRSCSYCCS
eukprot:g245.t1